MISIGLKILKTVGKLLVYIIGVLTGTIGKMGTSKNYDPWDDWFKK